MGLLLILSQGFTRAQHRNERTALRFLFTINLPFKGGAAKVIIMRQKIIFGIISIFSLSILGPLAYQKYAQRDIPNSSKQQAKGTYIITEIDISAKDKTPFLPFTTELQHKYIGKTISLNIKPQQYIQLLSNSAYGDYINTFQNKIFKYKETQKRKIIQIPDNQHPIVEYADPAYWETDFYELAYNDVEYTLLMVWERTQTTKQPATPQNIYLFIKYKDCYYQGTNYDVVTNKIIFTKE